MESVFSADIIENKFAKEYEFQNIVMLTVDIENYKVRLPGRYPEFMINKTLALQEAAFLSDANRALYPQAIADYKNSLINGYPFNPHGTFLNYTVTYNENCVLSDYYDTYTYTGGAHGSTLRKSNTFSLKTGKEIPLDAFFSVNSTYREKILNLIIAQAEKLQNENNYFFDDYKALIKKYFETESFYLTPEGMVFYYQQYEIAPYAYGIPEFTVDYSQVDYPPNC